MKKALLLTVFLLVLALLCACGAESATTTDTTTPAQTITTQPVTTPKAPETTPFVSTAPTTTTKAPETTEAPETEPSLSDLLEFRYEPDDRGYHVVGFGKWEGKELTIPSEYEGEPVVALGNEAFKVMDIKGILDADAKD